MVGTLPRLSCKAERCQLQPDLCDDPVKRRGVVRTCFVE